MAGRIAGREHTVLAAAAASYCCLARSCLYRFRAILLGSYARRLRLCADGISPRC